MAKEILDAVRNAESECEKIIASAKKEAELTIADAKEQANELIRTENEKAKANGEKRLEEVRYECFRTTQDAEKSAEAEGERLKAAAERNRQSVIEEAVKKFF